MKTILTALAIITATSGLSAAAVAPVSDGRVITSGKDDYTHEARSKKRVPGGSGCDDAHDKAEHAECRG